MGRLKVFIYFTLFIIANSAFAQVDTVTFRFERDVSTFKIRCQAQKVNVVSGDTTFTDFQITDTVNGAYTFDWGGDTEPVTDGLPKVIYEFLVAGTYTFNLSVYENSTGKTYTDSKSFEIRDIIRVPNVFTPGFDGVNDLFIVNSNGIIPLEILIYSRTGTLVHQSRSPIIVWDGRNSSGSFVSKGVYYYILTSDDPNIDAITGFIHIYYDDRDLENN